MQWCHLISKYNEKLLGYSLLHLHCWIFTRNSLYWEMLLVQVWTLGDNWLWLWQLIASLMLGCIATLLLLLLHTALQVEISRQRCVQNVWKSTTTMRNSKVASTTESGAKDYYWILGLFQGKKQKCCSGRRIDTNVHLGRDIKKERIQGESKNSRNLLCASHEFMRRFFRLESRLRPTVVLKRMQFPLLPPQLLLSSSPENSAKNCRSSQKSYYTTRQQKCHYFWNMKNFSVSLLTAAPAPRRK